MKNQKQLLALPVDTAPDINVPEFNEYFYKNSFGQRYTSKKLNFIYTARIVDGMLHLTAFTYDKKPIWRQFQTKNDHITQYIREKHLPSTASSAAKTKIDKAYHASIASIIQCEYQGIYTTDEASATAIVDFTGSNKRPRSDPEPVRSKGSAIDFLEKFQSDLRQKALNAKYDRIRKSVDDTMLQIKDLPKDFEKWLTDYPLKSSRYIFYKYKKSKDKIMTGWCSHCKTEVKVKGPHHHGTGVCPNCHSKVTFLAEGAFKQSNGFRDNADCAYLQKTKDGYCIRCFYVSKDYRESYYKNTAITYHEEGRYFYKYDLGAYVSENMYEWGDFYQTGEHRWKQIYGRTIITRRFIYFKNLSFLKDDRRKYCKIPEIARYCGKINVDNFTVEPLRTKQIEYLMKLGLYGCVRDLINGMNYGVINTTAKKLVDVLGVTKDDIPTLRKLNADCETLELYRIIKNAGAKPSADMIGWILKNGIGHKYVETILVQSTFLKMQRYITEQFTTQPETQAWYRKSISNITSDWADYIESCQLLEWDIKSDMILYPKNLSKAHDAAQKLIRSGKLGIPAIARIAKELDQKYGYQTQKLLIRAPKEHKEMVNEGKKLHHCVATYAEKHAKRQTVILFIRTIKNPDKPFYTLELEEKRMTIVQCRGLQNCGMTDEVKKFVEQWKEARVNKSRKSA